MVCGCVLRVRRSLAAAGDTAWRTSRFTRLSLDPLDDALDPHHARRSAQPPALGHVGATISVVRTGALGDVQKLDIMETSGKGFGVFLKPGETLLSVDVLCVFGGDVLWADELAGPARCPGGGMCGGRRGSR